MSNSPADHIPKARRVEIVYFIKDASGLTLINDISFEFGEAESTYGEVYQTDKPVLICETWDRKTQKCTKYVTHQIDEALPISINKQDGFQHLLKDFSNSGYHKSTVSFWHINNLVSLNSKVALSGGSGEFTMHVYIDEEKVFDQTIGVDEILEYSFN